MRPSIRRPAQHPVGGPRVTDQSQSDDADINRIVKQYIRIGLAPQRSGGRYEDVSSMDFMAMRNFIADKEALFGGLSARVRARFGGDPYQLLRFVEDPRNREEAIKLGLIDVAKVVQQKARFEESEIDENGETPDSQGEAQKADDEAQPSHKPAKSAGSKGGKKPT